MTVSAQRGTVPPRLSRLRGAAPKVGATLLLVFLAQPPCAAEDLSWLTSDPTKVTPVYADDDWIVWSSAELCPGTRHHRARRRVRRYVLQRVGEKDTRLVLTTVGTYSHDVSTVLKDGTVGVSYVSTLVWIRPENQPATLGTAKTVRLERDGKPYQILGRTPGGTGLFLQAYALNENRPVLYVPLDGTELVWSRAVQVTDDAGVSVNNPPRPPVVPAGELVACGPFITNLKTGDRKTLDIHPGWWVVALDGTYAADLGGIIRLEDGHRTATLRGAGAGQQLIAIRDGLAYGVRSARGGAPEFFVADARGSGRVTRIFAIEAAGDGPWFGRTNVTACGAVFALWNTRGCFIFDGKEWRHQPWLKGMPD